MDVGWYDHRVHHIQVRLTRSKRRSKNLMMITREDITKDRAVTRNNQSEHTDT
jgi:hypothetical protein